MQYKIGYGLILNDDMFNLIRDYELDVLQKIGVHQGLRQPPHITIKRPFLIDAGDLEKYIDILKDFASTSSPMDMSYGPIKWFGNETAYLSIQSEAIVNAHNHLLSLLAPQGISIGDFESSSFIPHATLALEYTPDQTSIVREIIDSRTLLSGASQIDSVGLFLSLDDRHWVIVAIQKFHSH